MPRNRQRKIQKEKNKGIIDMAAEQFALLLWKQLLKKKENKILDSRRKKYLFSSADPSRKES